MCIRDRWILSAAQAWLPSTNSGQLSFVEFPEFHSWTMQARFRDLSFFMFCCLRLGAFKLRALRCQMPGLVIGPWEKCQTDRLTDLFDWVDQEEMEDVFLAGPPCQPFTRLSNKRSRPGWNPFDDPRAEVFLDTSRYIRLMSLLKTIFVVFPRTWESLFGRRHQHQSELNIRQLGGSSSSLPLN